MTFMSGFGPSTASAITAATTKRDALVAAQRPVGGLANGVGPLLAMVGDCVADPAEGIPNGAENHRAVSQLIIDSKVDVFCPLGDNVYLQGFKEIYDTEYHESYGRIYNRTYPVPGNHELQGVPSSICH
jgi:hypothetical protein